MKFSQILSLAAIAYAAATPATPQEYTGEVIYRNADAAAAKRGCSGTYCTERSRKCWVGWDGKTYWCPVDDNNCHPEGPGDVWVGYQNLC